jgi:hypothetical protein
LFSRNEQASGCGSRLCLAASVLALASSSFAATPFALVENGRAAATIVTATQPMWQVIPHHATIAIESMRAEERPAFLDRQISCPLCTQSAAHTLIPHLRSEHKMEPEVFRVRFPEQPLCTDGFGDFLKERYVRRLNDVLNYRLDVAGCPMTARYGVDHPLIPQLDPTFVWTDPAHDVAEAVEHNERVFLYGPSGPGKSALVREIAAVVQRPVRRVSLNGETSVADFIGH